MLHSRSRRTVGFIEPCLPSPAAKPPTGAGWLHEIKHDGFRNMAQRNGAGVWLLSRVLRSMRIDDGSGLRGRQGLCRVEVRCREGRVLRRIAAVQHASTGDASLTTGDTSLSLVMMS